MVKTSKLYNAEDNMSKMSTHLRIPVIPLDNPPLPRIVSLSESGYPKVFMSKILADIVATGKEETETTADETIQETAKYSPNDQQNTHQETAKYSPNDQSAMSAYFELAFDNCEDKIRKFRYKRTSPSRVAKPLQKNKHRMMAQKSSKYVQCAVLCNALKRQFPDEKEEISELLVEGFDL